MGSRRFENGGRRPAGGRKPSPRAPERKGGVPDRSGMGGATSGSSRLLLTRLHREGVVWDVYIATTSQAGRNTTRLEFEGGAVGEEKVRYSRPAEGQLLAALHSGAAVRRTDLEEALEQAIREGGGATGDSLNRS